MYRAMCASVPRFGINGHMPRDVSQLHYELIRGLMEGGVCPTNSAVAAAMGTSVADVEEGLRELASIHGVVLHPHVCEPWILHPFSLTPTMHWIEGERGSWWAPCVWCALGVAALAGGRARIHMRYGAEGESLELDVVDGVPAREDIWVHFAIPPVRAWDNVHQHCALVLPFHSQEEIAEWCGRHGVALGEAVPIAKVARLARTWYGSHASPEWRKWSVAEAQDIFAGAGLTSDFWRLKARDGHF